MKKLLTTTFLAVLAGLGGLGASALPAQGASPPTGHARLDAGSAAVGDWGYSQRFITETLPQPALVMAVRLFCFSESGCSASAAMTFGPTNSSGRAVTFTGTTATTVPLVDSLGKTVGTCTSTPAPSGAVACQVTVSAVSLADHGWLAAKTTVTFAKFSEPTAGEPLAFLGWQDSPTGANPGNNPVNDETLIVTTPAPNPLEAFIDPTAAAFAAGQAAQTEQAGVICASEGFCWAAAGTTFQAGLSPAGVYFPYQPGTSVTEYGLDVAFICRYFDAKSYNGPGTDVASCSLGRRSIVDHYGADVVELPVKAEASAYPQTKDYSLVIRPGNAMSGNPIGTGLVVVAPLAITSGPANGSVGKAYSDKLMASGGVPTVKNPFAPPVYKHYWSIASGSLPPGLTLVNNLVAGTPTKAGSYKLTLALNDGQGDSVTGTFTMTIAT